MVARYTTVCLLSLALLAGCLGDAGPTHEPASGVDRGSDTGRFLSPIQVSTERAGAEPVVDVASDGMVFVQGIGVENTSDLPTYDRAPGWSARNTVWRSTDGGESWQEVTPSATGENSTCDAFLHVGPDDTVYVVNCFRAAETPVEGASGTALQAYRSDDLGRTWSPLPQVLVPASIHRTWLSTDPDGTLHLVAEGVFPQLVTYHARSDDRGNTWTGPTVVDELVGFGSNLALGPDGTSAYLAHVNLFGREGQLHPNRGLWYLMASEDDGLTWENRTMFRLESRLTTSWQSLAVDPNGTIYMAWSQMRNGTSAIHYAFSTDRGATWTGPRVLVEPNGSDTLPWIDAPAPGVLEAAWYATDQRGLPDNLTTDWRVEHAAVQRADSQTPAVQQANVSATIHRGKVCSLGFFCEDQEARARLLDYLWVETGPDGRTHVAFTSTIDWPLASGKAMHAVERG